MMAEREKASPIVYKYKEISGIPCLIAEGRDQRFALIEGQWLLCMGESNSFTEDIPLPEDIGVFLFSILETARNTQNPPALESPKN